MKMKIYLIAVVLILGSIFQCAVAQDKNTNKGILREPREGYFEEILKGLDDYTPAKNPKKEFKLDFTDLDIPKSVDEFTSIWHNPPVSQGRTGTCWCFSTTSYLESEIFRLHNKKVKLSEMYTVYFEYLEKAKRFIEERGNSVIGEGSEANAVPRMWGKYGVVPEEVYTGLKPGQKFHDHKALINEINLYLQNLKTSNAWDVDVSISTIKSILNHYIGEPPAEFMYEGKKYTPVSYLKDYLKIDPDNYVDIMSLKEKPYYQQVEYEVSDNWWHDSSYYNVPLDVFMETIKQTIKNGIGMAIGGDVSEAGYDGWHNAAIIPSFDIPSEYINDDAREFRFNNGTTGDDHGIHLIGYQNRNGRTWFLIKDSGAGSRNGNAKGYYFYDEDYVKLKIVDFMVNKEAVKDLLTKFNKK
jgi:bleomycin hydrolase